MNYISVENRKSWLCKYLVWRRKKFKSKKLGPKRGGKKKKLKIESRDLGRCSDWPTAGKMFHFFCCFNDEEIVVKKKNLQTFFVSAVESRDSLNGFWLAQKIKNSLNWRRHHVTALKGFSLDATRKHLNNSINIRRNPSNRKTFAIWRVTWPAARSLIGWIISLKITWILIQLFDN